MVKKKILILGADGMLGRTIYLYLKKHNELKVSATSRKNKKLIFLEAKNPNSFKKILKENDYVINCIGINDVTRENINESVYINSEFPKIIDKLAEKFDFKFINVSSDAVFNPMTGKVTENSKPNPKDLYGKTKLKGETKSINSITIRTSIIGFSTNKKKGFLEWIVNSNKDIKGYDNQLWSGCTNLQFAKFCEYLITDNNFENLRKRSNIFHFAPLGPVTKYEMSKKIITIMRKEIKISRDKSKQQINRYLTSIYFDKKFYKSYTTNLSVSIKELVKFENKYYEK